MNYSDFEHLSEKIRHVFDSPFFTLSPFFLLLFGLITIFILLVILIPFLIAVDDFRHNWKKSRREKDYQLYKKRVFDYLIDADDTELNFNKIEHNSHKDILIEILFGLIGYLDGEDKCRLRELFVKQGLREYCIRKIESPWSYNKAYYLERLSMISCEKVNEALFRKMLETSFAERRMYAMQALICRNPEKIVALFAGYKYQMSLWEQMNYYMLFVSRDIKVPDFHPLALSENTSVALFAIRMVRMFGQKIGTIEGYESLLKHPVLEVQFEMFRTLAEFGYDNLNSLLSDIMPRVSLQLQMHIMTYLAKINSTDTKRLIQYYKENDSPEFRLHILYCIYNFVEGGKSEIEQFARQKEDKTLQNLSIHLITNVV